jgi:hypothetical protein
LGLIASLVTSKEADAATTKKEKSERSDIDASTALWTKRLAIFTAALASATLLVAAFAGWQAYEMRQAGQDTRRALEATNRLAKAAEDHAVAARELAVAAQRSADSAESGQRAWIAPANALFAVPFAETERMDVRVFYRNSGQQPALGVIFNKDVHVLDVARPGRDEDQLTALVPSDVKRLVPNAACDDSTVTAQLNVVYPSATLTDFIDFPVFPDRVRAGIKSDICAAKLIFYFNGCFSYITLSKIHHSALCEYLSVFPTGQMDFRICPSGNWAD